MHVFVHVQMLNGISHQCRLKHYSTVRELKYMLTERVAQKSSRLRIFTGAGNFCEDDCQLQDLFEWCAVLDIMEPKTLRHIVLDITLHAIICIPACVLCGAQPTRKCSQCKLARYCSQVCQREHWHTHRKDCRKKSCVVLQCSNHNDYGTVCIYRMMSLDHCHLHEMM